MSLVARRRIHAPPETPRGIGVEVIHWEHSRMTYWWFDDDQQTPIRAQALAVIERCRHIALSPDVRVYLGDRTRFRLSALDAVTTIDDITDRPDLGIHLVWQPLEGHLGWQPLEGHLTVHVFDDAAHHDSLFLRRRRDNFW